MQLPSGRRINILHVVSKLPIGGVENMLFREVQAYNKERFDVSVCCIKEGGKIADKLMKSGYKVEILNRMKHHGFDWNVIKGIYNIIKRDNIHVLRTHQYHANFYGRIAGVLARVPVKIPTFHSRYESPNKPKIHRRFFNYLLYFFSDALVAVSDTIASDIIKYDKINPGKIRVIYNGIVINSFNSNILKIEARKTLSLPFDSLIIGSVGRLVKEKGHSFLIKGASELKDMYLAIAGDGPMMHKLKKLASKHKVNCIFLGQIDPSKIPLFLSSLDIFCFPSLWEGLPVALIEAMATGLPIVASDIPSHKEVMGNAGLYTPPGNEKKLTETLKMLASAPSLRDELGRRAKERAKIFSIENTIKAYETLFVDILHRKGLL